MKIIPKLQQGGSFQDFFTEYQPIQIQAPRKEYRSERSESLSKKDNDKGKLTQKDFFDMIKDIDGLPNEMKAIVNNLMNTFQINNLTGQDTNDIAIMYLSNLQQLKLAKDNKVKYNEAYKNAQENGAMHEPAISSDGKLVVQLNNGKIKSVDLKTYFNNQDSYHPLTVANIAQLRAFDSEFNFDPYQAFEIMNNGVGFEAFQKLIDTAKNNLGSTEYTVGGMFTIENEASKGLKTIQDLRKQGILNDLDLQQLGGSVTAEGLYNYKVINRDQLEQIKALTTYITAVLPDRAKTWAAWKLQTPNKNKATNDLVFQYLIGSQTTSHTFEPSYKGDIDKSKSSSDKDGDDSTKEGFVAQVQSGKGGNDTPFTYLLKNTSATAYGSKYYGMIEGVDSNCSLEQFLNKSGFGFLVTEPESITFGDIPINKDSYKDIMVKASAGAYAVTLPTKNGKLWLEAIPVYDKFQKELRNSGINPNTNEYIIKVQELLKKPEYTELSNIINNNGELNPNYSGHFLVLEALTSEKAKGIYDNKLYNLSDLESDFIQDVSDNDDLYDTLEEGLSTENNKYDLSNNFLYHDDIYRGNVYIPLNSNRINAMNADENKIKEQKAKEYEEMQQNWNKDQIKNINTSSNTLNKP